MRSISDQREKRVSLFIDDEELDLVADLHTETDLGERGVPVGWQLGLCLVKPSLPSIKVVCIFVAPKVRVVVESILKFETKRK